MQRQAVREMSDVIVELMMKSRTLKFVYRIFRILVFWFMLGIIIYLAAFNKDLANKTLELTYLQLMILSFAAIR